MKTKQVNGLAALAGMLVGLILWINGLQVALAEEEKASYRWLDPVSPKMLVDNLRFSLAPRLDGVDVEKAEALLAEFGQTVMPRRYELYLEIRKDAEDSIAKMRDLFPNGKSSDPSGGTLFAKMAGETASLVGYTCYLRDNLCFFALLKEAGVFTAEELSKIAQIKRSVFLMGPEGIDYPEEISEGELTLGEENERFAVENYPKTMAVFRKLASLRREGAVTYNRVAKMAHEMDAARVGEDMRILATRLLAIKTRLRETDDALSMARLKAAIEGSSKEALAKVDLQQAQTLAEFAKTMAVRAYYLRKTRVPPVVDITALGQGQGAGEARRIQLPGGAMMEMVWCPPGTFMMGSPLREPGHDDDEKQHQVTLTKGFWIAKTEVTQAQWQSVMEKNRSQFKGVSLPVENVYRSDCQEFCKKAGLSLPTEAQWEYACRAGTTTALPNGDTRILGKNNAPALDEIAWYGGNSSVGWSGTNGTDTATWTEKQYPDGWAGTHPVGEKAPNAWGLHDMIGNVQEWVEDYYGEYMRGTEEKALIDPLGAYAGTSQVVCRGGGWGTSAARCRSAFRWGMYDERRPDLGFRPVKNVP